jgi:hypothetical protein
MSSGFITNISGLFSSAVCEITRQNSLFIWSQHATLSCSYHDQGSSVSKVVNLKAGSSINTPHSIAIQMNVKAIVDHNGDVLGFYARDEDVEIDTSGNYQLNVFYPVSGQSKAINYPGKTSSSELNFSYMSSSTTEYDKSIIAVSSVGRVYSFTLQNLNQAETAVEITEDVVLSAFVENDYFLYLNDSVLGDVLLTGNNANVYNSVGASYGYRNIDLEYHAIGDYFVKYNANFPPELNTLDVHNKSNGAFVKNQVLDETGLCMFRKRSVGNMLVYSCDALESINIIDAQTLTDDVITNIDLESSAVVFLTSHMERPSAEAEVKLMVYEYSSSLDSTAVYELVGRSLNLVMTFDTPVNYLWAASLTRNGVVNMVSSMMFTDDPFATYSYGLIDGGDISYR